MSSREKDTIQFTLGKGNQSAICGGVTPMKIVETSAPAAKTVTPGSPPPAAVPAKST